MVDNQRNFSNNACSLKDNKAEVYSACKIAQMISPDCLDVVDLSPNMYLKDLLESEVFYYRENDIIAGNTYSAAVISRNDEYLDDAALSLAASVSDTLILSVPTERRDSFLSSDAVISALYDFGFLLHSDSCTENYRNFYVFKRAVPESLSHYYHCSGCGACANTCTNGALVMKPFEWGYLRPSVDSDQCTNCNACVRVCPQLNYKSAKQPHSSCFAYMNKDAEKRLLSSSGGVFSEFAESFIQNGGVVFGVRWNKDLRAEFAESDTIEGLAAFRRSKYMQAEMGFNFRKVKSHLSEGKKVLFCGCPCQVAGLKSYLGKDHNNLYTIDLFCNQSPASGFFSKYIADCYEGGVVKFEFRAKSSGWNFEDCRAINEDGQLFLDNRFMLSYIQRHMMPLACSDCRFKNYSREGDITIGDFWRINEFDRNMDDTFGTSAILVNSAKGTELWQSVSQTGKVCSVPKERLRTNAVARRPFDVNRARFMELCSRMSFEKAHDIAVNKLYDIGLVVEHLSGNYGSVLTSYAMYQVTKDLDLNPLILETEDKGNALNIFKVSPYSPWENVNTVFPEYIDSPSKIYELNKHCEMFLVGSDQLFASISMSRLKNLPNLFMADSSKKKICYAGSFGLGKDAVDEQRELELSYFLNRFDSFSCREHEGVSFVNRISDTHAEWVLDPIFLCAKEHFVHLSERGRTPTDKFIFAYILDPDKEKVDEINKFAKQNGMETVFFTSFNNARRNLNQADYLGMNRNVMPFAEDFLKCIKLAEMVITDSFHAMCFSLIFEKPFFAFVRIPKDRFFSLSHYLGLDDRLVYDTEDLALKLNEAVQIDYVRVNKAIDFHRRRSVEWLKNAISEPQKKKSLTVHDFAIQTAITQSESVRKDLTARINKVHKDSHRIPSSLITKENLDWLKSKSLVVWGCGFQGKSVSVALSDLGVYPEMFIDSKEDISIFLCGNVLYNIQKPNMLSSMISRKEQIGVLVAIENAVPVFKQLEALGLKRNADFKGLDLFAMLNYSICRTGYVHNMWEDRFIASGNAIFENYRDRVAWLCRFVSEGDRSVIDFGAGAETVRSFLADNVCYYPVDYKARSNDTVVCDFNKKEFPDITADVGIISGLLEYIFDVDWFLDRVTSSVQKLLLSYHTTDATGISSIEKRLSKGWVSFLSRSRLIKILGDNGFKLEKEFTGQAEGVYHWESYFVFVKNDGK